MGGAHRREDHPDHRAGLRDRGADGLPRRLRRRPDHRPGGPVPGPPRRRQDLLEPGAGQRARSRRCVRCSARRRPAARTSRRSATSWSWSRATRRCTWAPTGWSRWSPARRPRWRRWAGRGCTAPSRGVGHFLCKNEDAALGVVRRYLSYLPSNWRAPPRRRRRPPTRADRPARASARRASGRRSTCAATCGGCWTPARSSRSRRCGRARLIVGFGAAGRRGRRRRGQQLDVQGRRAVRRLRRQGHPLHPALRRVQRAAGLPVRRARLHGRHGRREAGDHPPRREDDHGRVARRPCRRSASSCARRTARGSTRWPVPASSPTPRWRCRPRRSR